MNTGDLCPEGKKRHIEWFMWKEKLLWTKHRFLLSDAWQAYRQHVDVECDICKQAESE